MGKSKVLVMLKLILPQALSLGEIIVAESIDRVICVQIGFKNGPVH